MGRSDTDNAELHNAELTAGPNAEGRTTTTDAEPHRSSTTDVQAH